MELERFQDLPDLPDDEEEAPEQPRPYLEEVRSLRKYPIPKYPMFIGRDKRGGICVPVSAVSRKHAKVYEQEEIFYIQDLGSINGTYLNDKRILDPVELMDGDRIKIAVTKQYSKGVREFTFRYEITESQKGEGADRNALFRAVGLGRRREEEGVLLRHCICKVSKRDIVSVLKADSAKRVALIKMHVGHKIVHFHSLTPFKLRDTLIFSIEHPKLPESLKFTIRVNKVSEKEMKVQQHEAEILKATEKHTALFNEKIKESPLICYITSQMKE